MALGIRGFNPIWSEVDLQGHLFDDTFYMFILENTIPYIPAIVYHTPDLTQEWDNPIRFLANGTLPIDIYFESEVVYRLEFRQGPTQAYPLIYEVNNYVAGTGGSTPVDTVAFASSNQITNPQFSLINFTSPWTISATDPDPIEIGPGWFLDVAGTGSVTITQVPLNSTNANPSNAPYALQLTLVGWAADSIFLRQRFQQNGMLWADKIISSTITTRVEGAPRSISAILVDSNSATLGTVLSVPAVNEAWNEFTGYAQLPATTNPDTPPVAYIDYKLAIPNNIDIYVTSIQLVVQELPIEPSFEQDSIDRQIDHTFHYYKPGLEYKPIPSYLVGWDFPLNPAQFGSTQAATAIGANKSKYVWDQTIIFQSADSGVGVTRGANGELLLTAAATTKMAVIQYLGATEAKKLLNSPLCVNVSARASTATTASVSLWYTTDVTLPVITTGTNNSIVLTLDANGLPATQNGTWTEVPKPGSSKQFVIGTNATTNFNDYPLSGWDLEGVVDAGTTFFAIVIGTASVTIAGTVGFNSISLQAGSIATRPAPQTLDEVLRDCQYYYETSFAVYTTASPIVASELNAVVAPMNPEVVGGATGCYPLAFGYRYSAPKRVASTLAFYSGTSTTTGKVEAYLVTTTGGLTFAEVTFATYFTNFTHDGVNGFSYYGNTAGSMVAPAASASPGGANISYHFTANSRLGEV